MERSRERVVECPRAAALRAALSVFRRGENRRGTRALYVSRRFHARGGRRDESFRRKLDSGSRRAATRHMRMNNISRNCTAGKLRGDREKLTEIREARAVSVCPRARTSQTCVSSSSCLCVSCFFLLFLLCSYSLPGNIFPAAKASRSRWITALIPLKKRKQQLAR